jgi:uncharacterized protein YndB with AHSA1/START domain
MTSHQVLITRDFDAPRELVFAAWSDLGHLLSWYSPRGCDIAFRSFEFREGSQFHSCIRTPTGKECWCMGHYRQIIQPELIEFTMVVCNEEKQAIQPVDAGMDSHWPQETVVTVAFADLDGRTRLTLRQTVDDALAKRTGAHPGWVQMLDRLAEQLTK